MLRKWLNSPYPFVNDLLTRILLTILLAFIAFLFLFYFRPFQLDIVESKIYFIGFGMTGLLGMGIVYVIGPFIFPSLFDPEKWNIRKQIVFISAITFMIGVFNYLYNSTIGAEIAPQYSLLKMLSFTLAVGILPILVLTYVFEKYEKKKNQYIASNIQVPEEKQKEDTLAIIPDANKDEKLDILCSAFLYAESHKNYCLVYYLFQGSTHKKLLRLSLKNLNEQLDNKSQFVRCHRSYVINIEHIENIIGNARSLEIKLKHIEKNIPVSRTFDKKKLEQLK